MQETNKKILITGGPGFGKSTILNALELLGFKVEHEISRQIIKEQLNSGGDILPWKNLETFSRIVIEKRIKQFCESPPDEFVFFDRGIPDVIAYMNVDNLDIPAKYVSSLKDYSYFNEVFVTPPWKEIFLNDNERLESFDDALKIHKQICETYNQLGYTLVNIPSVSVNDRVEFILNYLNIKKANVYEK